MAIETLNKRSPELTNNLTNGQSSVDISRIKRAAKANRKRDGSMTYMQHLDQAAKTLYGVRHFHEAQTRFKRSIVPAIRETAMTPVQYYLRSVQEYYLDL